MYSKTIVTLCGTLITKLMDAIFQPIDFEKWSRKPYFDYYINKIKCKYTLNANIDITELRTVVKDKKIKFFPTFLYVILRAVNLNQEFRMSYDKEGRLGFWNFVVPSYTIFHDDDKTFSDVWSEYNEDFEVFYETVLADMEKYKGVKGIKAKANCPENFCSVSSLPWLSFTGFAQDTYEPSDFLFPLIRFGKYTENNNRILVPIAVFVNHAVADGYHTSKLINDIQKFSSTIEEWCK